eukprot:2914010-Prymnesium_polylepis.1
MDTDDRRSRASKSSAESAENGRALKRCFARDTACAAPTLPMRAAMSNADRSETTARRLKAAQILLRFVGVGARLTTTRATIPMQIMPC